MVTSYSSKDSHESWSEGLLHLEGLGVDRESHAYVAYRFLFLPKQTISGRLAVGSDSFLPLTGFKPSSPVSFAKKDPKPQKIRTCGSNTCMITLYSCAMNDCNDSKSLCVYACQDWLIQVFFSWKFGTYTFWHLSGLMCRLNWYNRSVAFGQQLMRHSECLLCGPLDHGGHIFASSISFSSAPLGDDQRQMVATDPKSSMFQRLHPISRLCE